MKENKELDNLMKFLKSICKQVVALEGCPGWFKGDRCNHNAAYVIDNTHPLGRLVQCTRCDRYQIQRNKK